MKKIFFTMLVLSAQSAFANSTPWQPIDQDKSFEFTNCECVATDSKLCSSNVDIKSVFGYSSPGSSRSTDAYGDGDWLILHPFLKGSSEGLSYVKISKTGWDQQSIPYIEKSWFYQAFSLTSKGDIRKNFGKFVAGLQGQEGPWPGAKINWNREIKQDLKTAGRFDIDLIGGNSLEVSNQGAKKEISAFFVSSHSQEKIGTIWSHEFTFNNREVVGYKFKRVTTGIDKIDSKNKKALAAMRLIKAGIWSNMAPVDKSSELTVSCVK